MQSIGTNKELHENIGPEDRCKNSLVYVGLEINQKIQYFADFIPEFGGISGGFGTWQVLHDFGQFSCTYAFHLQYTIQGWQFESLSRHWFLLCTEKKMWGTLVLLRRMKEVSSLHPHQCITLESHGSLWEPTCSACLNRLELLTDCTDSIWSAIF